MVEFTILFLQKSSISLNVRTINLPSKKENITQNLLIYIISLNSIITSLKTVFFLQDNNNGGGFL